VGSLERLPFVLAIPVAIAAYSFDIADRLDWINLSNKDPVVQGWGTEHVPHGDALYMRVNSAPLLKYRNNFNIMLIIASMYSNIDMMTDVAIDKS
jgi:hypothetical protein